MMFRVGCIFYDAGFSAEQFFSNVGSQKSEDRNLFSQSLPIDVLLGSALYF